MAAAKTADPCKLRIRSEDEPDVGKWPPESPAWDNLCLSISDRGVMTPIFVDAKMTCVSGHYRLRAAQIMKVRSVPIVIVRDMADVDRYFERLAGVKP